MTTPPTRYPEINVSGPPRELGRQLGEAARDEVRGFCEIALARFQKTVNISRDRAMDIAGRSREFAEAYAPDMVEELRGTAEAAGVSLDDLMLLQVRNQLTDEEDSACTAFSLPARPAQRRGPMIGQNWDADPALDPFTIVLTRHPDGKPPYIACTQAGLIAYMGLNATGIAACVNTLPAPNREVGVPHYFTLREIFESSSLDQAVHAVERAQRAIPANIMLGTPQGPADLEVTIDNVHVLCPDSPDGHLTHTNHCVHEDLLPVNDQFPELIQSHARKQRIDEQLESASTSDLETMQAILSDHDGYPKSICRHPNDHPTNGFWVTVFSIIIEPDERRLHITRGTPCDHPYEMYELTT